MTHRFGPLDGPIPNEITTDFAYLPFGGGKRKCIGDQFALFESLVALSMIMRRYEFTLAPGEKVGMTTGATIHTTNGLNMYVKKRVIPRAGPTHKSNGNGKVTIPLSVPQPAFAAAASPQPPAASYSTAAGAGLMGAAAAIGLDPAATAAAAEQTGQAISKCPFS
jgi:hypothetical protein